MSSAPTTDPKFLGTLESWFRDRHDILVLIRRSHAAGSKDFELYSSFSSLAERIRGLSSLACITAFRQPQLPLRGVVDETLIARCLNAIPDGTEYLILETEPRVYPWGAWFHHVAGVSHSELRGDLEESKGVAVAVGPYPPWLDDTEDVVSAVVPDEHGATNGGIY